MTETSPARRRRGKHALRWAFVLIAVLSAIAVIRIVTRPTQVEVVVLQRRPLVQTIVTVGRVRPQRIRLASLIFGRVTEVLVAAGDHVTAGAALLRLDSREAEARVAEARASLDRVRAERTRLVSFDAVQAGEVLSQARIRAQEAAQDVARLSPLAVQGAVPSNQLKRALTARDLAESALREAEQQQAALKAGGQRVVGADAVVKQAQASLAMAETHLDYCEIKAPTAATVLEKDVEVGDVLQAGASVLELDIESQAELVAHLDERHLSELRLGQTAIASAEAYPKERFAAEVSFVAPAVDPQRGTVEVRLRVPKAPAYLRADMTVSIDIEVARRDAALSIPTIAVRDLASDSYVLVAQQGRAVRRKVAIGIRDDAHVEVLEGLQADDRVIVSSPLKAGVAVRAETKGP